ncbi:MAG: PucR family transcriptional regulator [Leucobacter sp.]
MVPPEIRGIADLGAIPLTGTPTIQLGQLLREYRLGLVFIAGIGEGVNERPLRWVHASELEDPTPFLPPRTVLLTTGARFSALPTQTDADGYVQRLIDASVTALGFSVGLHWDRVPLRLVSACDRLGLPLIRVPYDTPFVAISQTAATLINAIARDRDLWALESQRAVTAASLHRDGLGAVVREAATRLDHWVCITDRAGHIVEFEPRAARETVRTDWIRRETRRLIERGVSAGRIGAGDRHGLRMQTLGRRGQVLGVLVVADHGTPDNAERALLGLVTALATVQLEHRAGVDAGQVALNEAILQLLLAGETTLAERIATGAAARIPRGPVIAVRYDEASAHDTPFGEDLRSFIAGSPGLLNTRLEDRPVVIAETRHLPALRRLLSAHRVPSGISERGTIQNLEELLGSAERALDFVHATSGTGPVDYLPALHSGVLHLLDDSTEARHRADSLLAPIRQYDQRNDDTVEASLRTWLQHHGQTSPASAELGIHRHTLKSRVQTAARLLQADLDSPDTRAELWTALRLATEAR